MAHDFLTRMGVCCQGAMNHLYLQDIGLSMTWLCSLLRCNYRHLEAVRGAAVAAHPPEGRSKRDESLTGMGWCRLRGTALPCLLRLLLAPDGRYVGFSAIYRREWLLRWWVFQHRVARHELPRVTEISRAWIDPERDILNYLTTS